MALSKKYVILIADIDLNDRIGGKLLKWNWYMSIVAIAINLATFTNSR